jgi:hypothetical protein
MRWLFRLPVPCRHQEPAREPAQQEQDGPKLADPPWLEWLVAQVEGRPPVLPPGERGMGRDSGREAEAGE